MTRECLDSDYIQIGLTNYAGQRIERYEHKVNNNKVAVWKGKYVTTSDEFIDVVKNRRNYNWKSFKEE